MSANIEEKYETYILEFVKNNGINLKNNTPKCDDLNSCFFMFDYFDYLYCRKLEDKAKNYTNYFSMDDTLGDPSGLKISFKPLSIYRLKSKEANEKMILLDNSNDDMALSDLPFIGIIQITLCPRCFTTDSSSFEVKTFLNDCENKINSIADATIKKMESSVIVKKQLFRSSTTGDFCLIIRTDSIKAIYNIALMLDNPSDEEFPTYVYTNIGMESRKLEGKEYLTLSQKFVDSHNDLTFSLRFTGSALFGNDLVEHYKNNNSGFEKTVNGSFGKYDYLVNLTLKEFSKTYPELCNRVFEDIKNEKNVESFLFDKKDANCINERVFVNLGDISVFVEQDGDEKSNDEAKNNYINRLTKVEEDNDALYKKIDSLKKYMQYFKSEYSSYKELHRSMRELYKSFASLGIDNDSYINWKIFTKDLNILCENICKEIKEYECNADKYNDEDRTKERAKILSRWRANLYGISQYTKLVQNINYQSYQAPTYEVQTHIDTEKLMISYRELLEQYFYEGKSDEGNIYALIYSELEESRVIVKSPYSYTNAKIENKHIICKVPSYEYFGRMYDLIPLVIHEGSHQIRVLSREIRNEYLLQFTLRYISNRIIVYALNNFGDYSDYGYSDEVGQQLCSIFTEHAISTICDDKTIKESSFDQIYDIIKKFIYSIFRDDKTPGLNGGRTEKSVKEDISNKLITRYREINNDFNVDDKHDFLNLLNSFVKSKNKLTTQKKLELLIDKMLGQYNEIVNNEVVLKIKGKKARLRNLLYKNIKDIKVRDAKGFFGELKSIIDNVEDIKVKAILVNYSLWISELITMYNNVKNIYDSNTIALDDFLLEFYNKICDSKELQNIDISNENPNTIRVIRAIGLGGVLGNKQKTYINETSQNKFKDIVSGILKNISATTIFNYFEYSISLYRESCADLLMAYTLKFDPFGYFRFVTQMISDAKHSISGQITDEVNYERFKHVVAALIGNDTNGIEKGFPSASEKILEKGILYSKSICLCILDAVIIEIDKQKNKEKEEKIRCLEEIEEILYLIMTNLEEYYIEADDELYDCTFLYAVVNNDSNKLSKNGKEFWKLYIKHKEILSNYMNRFWRMSVFCQSIGKIVKGKHIEVEIGLYNHLCSIIRELDKKKARMNGKNNVSLQTIGEYYNDPESPVQLTNSVKLEKTIDFIQTYYYNNRYYNMKAKGRSDE